MAKKIPILICIDVEPDERMIDSRVRKDWTGFEQIYEFFKELRPTLQDVTKSPAHFSWLFRMDPQVAHTYGSAAWVGERYSQAIAEIKSTGDDTGLHVHPWRWDETSDRWVLDFDQNWVDHCV